MTHQISFQASRAARDDIRHILISSRYSYLSQDLSLVGMSARASRQPNMEIKW